MAVAVDLIRRFRGLRALVIGDVILDSYLEGSATRLCSEGPVPVVRQTAEERTPGGAANSAANLRALGAEVILLGVVGADPAGRLLRAALSEHNVSDRWLVEDQACSTLHKLRILADNQYVVRFDEGVTARCSTATNDRLIAHLEAEFPRVDLVVVSDYGYGVAAGALLERLRELRAADPRVLVVDSKRLAHFRHAGATAITPNYREACLTVDPAAPVDAGTDPARVETVARGLLAEVDAELAAVTLGPGGVFLASRAGLARRLPAHPVPYAHDVGAGDSFTAALALALGAGAAADEAARIGLAAGAIAVTKRRTAVVRHQELLQRVSARDGAGVGAAAQGWTALRAELDLLPALPDGRRPRIVFTNGVFDILHAGHVHFLRAARALGDILVVGVNSDRSAAALKGKHRPINGQHDRLALVAALEPVDHVLLFDEETPREAILALRPDLHVKGGDYAGETLPEAEAVHAVGGQIHIVPLLGDLSTSGVIDRIIALAAPPAPALAERAQGAGATL